MADFSLQGIEKNNESSRMIPTALLFILLCGTGLAQQTDLTFTGYTEGDETLEGEVLRITCSYTGPFNDTTISWACGSMTNSENGAEIQVPFVVNRIMNGNPCSCSVGHVDWAQPQTIQFSITVNHPPEITISPSTDIIKREGLPLTLICGADGTPKPDKFKWQTKTDNLTRTTITWSSISRTDAGIYICHATSTSAKYGTLTSSATATITVTYPPNVNLHTSAILVDEGDTVTVEFRCQVEGVPDTYTFYPWHHSIAGVTVRELEGNVTGSRSVLTMSGMTYQDSGVYRCIVSNGVPNDLGFMNQSNAFEFTVTAPPKFKAKQPSRETIEVGYGFILSIPVYSKSDIQLDWIKSSETNSTPILNVTNSPISWNFYGERVTVPGYRANVYIEQIQPDDAGTYQANVTNTQGSSLIDVQLDIGGLPATPLNFSIARSNATYVMLQWISGNNGGYPQVFLLEYQVATANAWKIMTVPDLGEFQNITAEISDLVHNSDYHFRVKARSDRIRGPNKSGYTHVLSYITPPGSTPTSSTLKPTARTGGLDGGAIAGIVVGVLVVIVILVIIMVCVKCRRCKTHTFPSVPISVENSTYDNNIQIVSDISKNGTDPNFSPKISNENSYKDKHHETNAYDTPARQVYGKNPPDWIPGTGFGQTISPAYVSCTPDPDVPSSTFDQQVAQFNNRMGNYESVQLDNVNIESELEEPRYVDIPGGRLRIMDCVSTDEDTLPSTWRPDPPVNDGLELFQSQSGYESVRIGGNTDSTERSPSSYDTTDGRNDTIQPEWIKDYDMAGDAVFDQREKTPADRVPSYESMTLQEPPSQEHPRPQPADAYDGGGRINPAFEEDVDDNPYEIIDIQGKGQQDETEDAQDSIYVNMSSDK